MKKLFYFLLLSVVLVSCKKDDEKGDGSLSCDNDFAFLKKSATATFDYFDFIGLFNDLKIQYTPNGSTTKVDLIFSGAKTEQYTLYYSACGSKLYQSTSSDMKNAQMIIDFDTPVNQVFKAKTYSAQGDLVESEYRIVDKNYEYTFDGKKVKAYKVENVQFFIDEYMPFGYEIFSKEYGQLEYSSMDSKREIQSYQ